MIELTPFELEKYKRQMQLPGFGVEAQRRLKSSAVLVTRLGGLGGPTAFALAAAGVGKLVIAHGGALTPSNLNRQILMRGDGVGQPRAPQAEETLRRFAPDLEIVTYARDVSEECVAEWVNQVDVACATTPSFSEHYVLNRECVRQGKPLVHGGMNGMEGQLTTILPGRTPCVECLVPETPDWWDSAGFGVIGAVPGCLGNLMALEAIKVITGFGEPLAGVMLTMDLEVGTFGRYSLTRRADCPVCGS